MTTGTTPPTTESVMRDEAQPDPWRALYLRMKNVAAGYSNYCDETGSTRRLEREFEAIDNEARAALASRPVVAQPVARIVRNAAHQISMQAPDGGPFDMSQHVGALLYADPAPAVDRGLSEALRLAKRELECCMDNAQRGKVCFDGDDFHDTLTAVSNALAASAPSQAEPAPASAREEEALERLAKAAEDLLETCPSIDDGTTRCVSKLWSAIRSARNAISAARPPQAPPATIQAGSCQASGEVAGWQERYAVRKGWSAWYHIDRAPSEEVMASRTDYQWRPVYAHDAPPAGRTLTAALEQIVRRHELEVHIAAYGRSCNQDKLNELYAMKEPHEIAAAALAAASTTAGGAG